MLACVDVDHPPRVTNINYTNSDSDDQCQKTNSYSLFCVFVCFLCLLRCVPVEGYRSACVEVVVLCVSVVYAHQVCVHLFFDC